MSVGWEHAATWVSRVTDPNQRHALIQQVASNWLRNDPAAATAWLSRTDLPLEQQHQLLQMHTGQR
jgi:hypothetical protein